VKTDDLLQFWRLVDHPSERDLDAFAFDPEDRHAGTALADHIASCKRCRLQVERLRRENAGFLQDRPYAVLKARIMRPGDRDRIWWWRRMGSLGWPRLAIAGSLLLILLMLIPIVWLRPGDKAIKLRGDSNVELSLSVIGQAHLGVSWSF
jgi:hypothetical protein